MALSESLTIDEVIKKLNGLLDHDREAVSRLFLESRVSCNQAMADHPSVQVAADNGFFSLGIMGVLNGLFGTIEGGDRDGWGALGLWTREDGLIDRFERTEGWT